VILGHRVLPESGENEANRDRVVSGENEANRDRKARPGKKVNPGNPGLIMVRELMANPGQKVIPVRKVNLENKGRKVIRAIQVPGGQKVSPVFQAFKEIRAKKEILVPPGLVARPANVAPRGRRAIRESMERMVLMEIMACQLTSSGKIRAIWAQ